MVLSSTLLVVALGATVDFGRFVLARTSLQAAVDGAALQGATSALSDEHLATLIQQAVERNFDEQRYGAVSVESRKTDDGTLEVEAALAFETDFIRIGGTSQFNVTVTAEAGITAESEKSLEVALVLDVAYMNPGSTATTMTWSQLSARVQGLQNAASAFSETILADSASDSERRVALVPYADAVNLGDRSSEAKKKKKNGTCTTTGCSSYSWLNICDTPGCQYYYYKYTNSSYSGYYTWASITDCVTERIGDQAYTDEPLSASYVGRYYGWYCNRWSNALEPLTDDVATLDDSIATIYPGGPRAGHIGLAWGWYTLSPTFGLFTGESAPAAYDDEDTQKAIVFVSFGSNDAAYCNGQLSLDSIMSVYTHVKRIMCNATNGLSNAQAKLLCTAIKATGIAIYTVGVGTASNTEATDVLTSCASSSATYHVTDSVDTLDDTLASIATTIAASTAGESDDLLRLVR